MPLYWRWLMSFTYISYCFPESEIICMQVIFLDCILYFEIINDWNLKLNWAKTWKRVCGGTKNVFIFFTSHVNFFLFFNLVGQNDFAKNCSPLVIAIRMNCIAASRTRQVLDLFFAAPRCFGMSYRKCS